MDKNKKREMEIQQRYYRLRAKLRNLYRKMADIRKMEHNILRQRIVGIW